MISLNLHIRDGLYDLYQFLLNKPLGTFQSAIDYHSGTIGF